MAGAAYKVHSCQYMRIINTEGIRTVRPLDKNLDFLLDASSFTPFSAFGKLIQAVGPVTRFLDHEDHPFTTLVLRIQARQSKKCAQTINSLYKTHLSDTRHTERMQFHPPSKPHRPVQNTNPNMLSCLPSSVNVGDLEAGHLEVGERG